MDADWIRARNSGYQEPPSGYGQAEVCINGHAVTGDIARHPEFRSKYCSICGAETITSCPHCHAPIRGSYHSPGVVIVSTYSPPPFCHNCGKPLPWTEAAINAACELAEEVEEFTQEDREKFKSAVADMTTDSPRTELASLRYKKLMAKAGPAIGSAMNKIVISVLSEAAKKMVGL